MPGVQACVGGVVGAVACADGAVGLAACGCFRQARYCADGSGHSAGDLANVWMTCADATTRAFFSLSGVCYYFHFLDASSPTAGGTLYAAEDTTAASDCACVECPCSGCVWTDGMTWPCNGLKQIYNVASNVLVRLYAGDSGCTKTGPFTILCNTPLAANFTAADGTYGPHLPLSDVCTWFSPISFGTGFCVFQWDDSLVAGTKIFGSCSGGVSRWTIFFNWFELTGTSTNKVGGFPDGGVYPVPPTFSWSDGTDCYEIIITGVTVT